MQFEGQRSLVAFVSLVLEEKIVSRPASTNPFSSLPVNSIGSRPCSVNGPKNKCRNGRPLSSTGGNLSKTVVSVPIKLSKENQAKFIKALRAKGGDGLNGNAIDFLASESGVGTPLLEALKKFTDRRITKCSFVYPDKVINGNRAN